MVASLLVKKIIKALGKRAANQKTREGKAASMNYDAQVLNFISDPKVTKTIISGTKNKPKKTVLNVGPLSGRQTTEEFREAAKKVEEITSKAVQARGKSTGGLIKGHPKLAQKGWK